jgi:hypothetical protein
MNSCHFLICCSRHLSLFNKFRLSSNGSVLAENQTSECDAPHGQKNQKWIYFWPVLYIIDCLGNAKGGKKRRKTELRNSWRAPVCCWRLWFQTGWANVEHSEGYKLSSAKQTERKKPKKKLASTSFVKKEKEMCKSKTVVCLLCNKSMSVQWCTTASRMCCSCIFAPVQVYCL